MNTIVRWNPFREMAAMQSAMDRIFDETWRNVRSGADSTLALDVHETDTSYIVQTTLPGANPDSIHVSVHDGVLTISSEITPTPVENTRTLIQERVYGKFTRSLRLPQMVDLDNVNAEFENGVLTLTLPKSPEAQPRQIPVRTHSNN
jgi:HSP20 family protein